MRYEVLGRVTAHTDSGKARLAPRHQLLLAVLIMADGATVAEETLIDRAWESRELDDPKGALWTNISYLRRHLRAAPDHDPIPLQAGGYRLLADRLDIDVFRFRAKAAQARQHDGGAAVRLTEEALKEWGPSAAGLFGGCPFGGLTESWADSSRERLRREHRDAWLFCLRAAWDEGAYDLVAGECEVLADDDAFRDEEFVEIWMRAAYRVGGRNRAMDIYHLAEESTARLLHQPISRSLTDLARRIREQDRSLGRSGTPTLSPPAGDTVRPATPEKGLTSMSESQPTFVFNNHDGSKIGAQGDFKGNVTINMEPKPMPAVDAEKAPADSGERES